MEEWVKDFLAAKLEFPLKSHLEKVNFSFKQHIYKKKSHKQIKQSLILRGEYSVNYHVSSSLIRAGVRGGLHFNLMTKGEVESNLWFFYHTEGRNN